MKRLQTLKELTMKRGIVVAGIVFAATTGFAGKEDRDFMTKEVQPAAKTAGDKWKASCGCALKITIDDKTLDKKDDMYAAKHFFEYITDGVGGYCNDAASKKALCQMKTLVVKKADDAGFTFKGGTGTASVYGNTSPSFEMVTK